MLTGKMRKFVTAKIKSIVGAADTCAMYFLAIAFISLIPTLSDAAIPISGGVGIGPNGISGGASIGGLSFSFGTGGAGTDGIGGALCTIVSWFTEGGVGAAVASLAVIFLGIGAFFGKVTWGMAIMFAAGIFAIFGAGEIVSAITGGLGQGC